MIERTEEGKTEVIRAYRCLRCDCLHAVDSDTYLLVSGNVTIGELGGLIGNNLKNGYVERSTVFCVGHKNKPSCLEIYLAQTRERIADPRHDK